MVSALPGLVILLCHSDVWSPRFIVFVALPAIVFFAVALLAPESSYFLQERTFATAQFTYGLIIGYLGSYTLARLGRKRVHSIVSIFLPCYCALLFLEIATPLKDVIADYMNLYPREYDFYAMADRDSALGGYRPKLFTSETSYVATSAFLMITIYVWSGRSKRKYHWAVFYAMALSALIRSPIVLVSFPVIMASALFDRTSGQRFLISRIASTAFVLTAAAALFAVGGDIIETRLEKVSSGSDYSTTYRTYGSVLAAWDVINEYPEFGVGPGTIELAEDIIISKYISLGVPAEAALIDWRMSINNALASALLHFGILGSILILLVTGCIVARDIPRSRIPAIAAIACYSLTYGAIYTPKFVVTFLCIIAASKLRSEPE